jgi:hypothetical protein
MKLLKSLLFTLLILTSTAVSVFAQIVEIGSYGVNIYNAPINTRNHIVPYRHSVCGFVIKPNEIDTSGYIHSISFRKVNQLSNSNNNNFINIFIYQSKVYPSSFNYVSHYGKSRFVYYDSTLFIDTTTGWIEFQLKDSFYYHSGNHLVICVEHKKDGYIVNSANNYSIVYGIRFAGDANGFGECVESNDTSYMHPYQLAQNAYSTLNTYRPVTRLKFKPFIRIPEKIVKCPNQSYIIQPEYDPAQIQTISWKKLPNTLLSSQSSGHITLTDTGTYVVSVLSSIGQTNSDTIKVLDSYNPNLTIDSFMHDQCLNGIHIPLKSNTPGSIFFGPGVINDTLFPNLAGSGSYIVYCSYTDSLGCSFKDSLSFTVHPNQTTNLFGLQNVYCSSDPPAYIIKYPSGGILSGTCISNGYFVPALLDSGFTQVKYIYTDTIGCSDSITKTVFIREKPVVKILTGNSNLCSNNDSIEISVTPFGGIFSGSVTNKIFDPKISGPGIYPVFYTFNDTNGCVNSDTIEITVNPAPNVIINSTLNTTCENSLPVQIYTSPIGGIFQQTYIINNSFHPEITGTGSFPVKYSFTNHFGCLSSDSIMITVKKLPNISLSNNTYNLCLNDHNDTLNFSPTGGIFGGNGIDNSGVFKPVVAGTGSHAITYKIDSNGCYNYDTIVLTVHQPPVVDAGIDKNIMCGQIATIGTSNPFQYSYNWFPNTNLSDSNQFITNADPLVSTKYFLTATDTATGCKNIDSMIVFVAGGPIISVTNDTSICKGSSVQLNVNGLGDFIWNTGDTLSTFNVNPAKSTLYIVTATLNNCSSTDSVLILVNKLPEIDLGNDTSLCKENSLTLNPGNSFITYLWNTNSTSQSIMVDSLMGSGYYSVLVTDSNQCKNSDSVYILFVDCSSIDPSSNKSSIQVFPNPNQGIFDIKGLDVSCKEGYSIELFDSKGKQIKKVQTLKGINNYKTDFNYLPTGMYYLVIYNSLEKHRFKVIIVK